MMKKTLNQGSGLSRVVPLRERWPEGLQEFLKDSAKQGFQPWVSKHSRLFSDWTLPNFALRPMAVHSALLLDEAEALSCYVYISKSVNFSIKDILELASKVSMLVVDATHAVAEDLIKQIENSDHRIVVVAQPDAFVDWALSEVFVNDWFSDSDSRIDAEISPLARLEKNVLVGPGSTLEDHVKVGSGARIGAGVCVGEGSVIGPGVVICDGVQIGCHSVIGPNSVIGTPGFGMVKYPLAQYSRQKVHVGSVCVGSRVRMGAFVSVDRGVFEDTVIGDDTQIDNHVQVAHNCIIGSGNVICSFVGFAGSVKMGSANVLAGQVGLKDHIQIGDRVIVASQSGVSRNLKNDECVKGYPLLPLKESLKVSVLISKLPELFERIKKLEKVLKS